jgi:outer membrane protein assembly factor BamD (BamD/ComL family)
MRSYAKWFAVVLGVLLSASLVMAQGGTKQKPTASAEEDLEKDSAHNLEVAWNYFKLKHAYVAALQRCEEIIAGDPAFAKIDKALFIAGESNLFLSQGKGKQKPSLYVRHDGENKRTLTSEEFRQEAREYLSQLVNDHPDSPYRQQAQDDLKDLGGVKPKEGKQ